MLRSIRIQNYKSINDLSLELGKVNVFIGENGSGKSNILEAMTLAGVAMNGSLENEQVGLRGVRASDAKYYRSGFDKKSSAQDILFDLRSSGGDKIEIKLSNDNQPFSKWKVELVVDGINFQKEALGVVKEFLELGKNDKVDSEVLKTYISIFVDSLLNTVPDSSEPALNISEFKDFQIYAPENFFLRNLNTKETYLEPLGYRGEGLLKLISIIKTERPKHYKEIVQQLNLIDWLDDFKIIDDSVGKEAEYMLTDRYLENGIASFDIRSSNEGFLFLLFYLTLFISDYTPKIFAIDNIDTALNPKLCSELIALITELAGKHDKQVIITTHNPSVLDGLNLNNEDERLFVISRGIEGNTLATRVLKREPLPGVEPLKLSEQFLRGYIGGLPKNF